MLYRQSKLAARGRFSGVWKTPWPIKTRFGTTDYRPKIVIHAKIHCNHFGRFRLQIWWIRSFSISTIWPESKRANRFSCLILQSKSPTPTMRLFGLSLKIFVNGSFSPLIPCFGHFGTKFPLSLSLQRTFELTAVKPETTRPATGKT